MYTFNPGPSAVYPAVRQYLTDAFDEGWLSAPHRSEKVTSLVRQAVTDLKSKLNVLGLYLLSRVLADREPIKTVHQHLAERAEKLYAFFEQSTPLQPLISNVEARSTTVIGLQGEASLIDEVKRKALEAGLHLGSGYGPLKNTSVRIANFPAVPDAAFEALVQFFVKEYPA